MTLEEAKENIYQLVTGFGDEGEFIGQIESVYEDTGLVKVICGKGFEAKFYIVRPIVLGLFETGLLNQSPYVGYNLNQPVLVKLDDKAFAIWKRHDDAMVDFAPAQVREKLIKPLEHYTSKVRPDGYVEMRFNELMRIFGDYCRHGYEVFDMNVLIERKDIDGL
ncbi:hypothetical protein [Spirosoma aerophilum]